MHHKNIGVIDAGSNSIKLVIFRAKDEERFLLTEKYTVNAKMGSYINNNGMITEEGISVLLKSLKELAGTALKANLAVLRITATAAVRNARNWKEIKAAAEELIELPFEVLNERSEAYYGYLAVKHSVPVRDCIIADLGGGSTEVSLMKRGEFFHFHSFPFGTLTLQQKFTCTISGETNIVEMRNWIMEQFYQLSWLKDINLPVVGIGGSAKAAGKILIKNRLESVPGLHLCTLSITEIQQLNALLLPLSLKERRKIKGLPKKRAAAIVPALTVFEELVNCSGGHSFIISENGLREGIMFEELASDLG
ncbi:hypothetical protein [Evansella clarkii]|uniref:Ppx/GppA phosphatase family protein n=1 Tax=Evansella clarkii TaxID=79879 RepID=UPI00143053CD|nr:hypothetical protein [Evansella clarkii]